MKLVTFLTTANSRVKLNAGAAGQFWNWSALPAQPEIATVRDDGEHHAFLDVMPHLLRLQIA